MNTAAILPPDNTEIEATLFLDILPLDERGEIVLPVEAYQQLEQRLSELPKLSLAEMAAGKNRTIPAALLDKLGEYGWPFSSGQLWRSKIIGAFRADPIYVKAKSSPPQSAVVNDGQFTRILIDIPEGIEAELQKVIEFAPDANEFDKLLREGLLRRQLTFKVLGYEAMAK